MLLWALGAALVAQQGSEEIGAPDLQRAQQQLLQNRSEVDRLLELRRRHDLGLPPGDELLPQRPAGPVTTEHRERLLRELQEQEAATAHLQDRWQQLKSMAEQLRNEAAQTVGRERRPVAVEVPAPGAPMAEAALPRDRQPAMVPESPATAAPKGSGPLNLPPPRLVIQGAEDRLQIAQALLQAGQALAAQAEAARSEQRNDLAVELDRAAKERLVRALDELAEELSREQPAYAALFCQGRTRELLFRHAERYEGLSLAKSPRDFQRREQEVRDPFLAIAARDVQKQGARGEVDVLGTWGRAATAAVEHFRWMNVHGNYQPKLDIEAITWSGDQTR